MEAFGFKTPNYLSDEDETKLKMVFPEEIWLLILNKIWDFDHYESLCAASPYFYKLLVPQRSRFLFSKVIKLCTTFMPLTDKALSSFLKCRAVCKEWKHGVDLMFHQTLSQTAADTTDWKLSYRKETFFLSRSQSCVMYRFFGAPKIKKFMETFHDSHFLTGRNPFPTRSIQLLVIIPYLSTDTHEYNIKFLDVLQLYGHHIWHCFIDVHWWQLQQALVFLRPLLQLLPQLKTLRIYQSIHYKEESMESLQNILRTNPLPKFEKLQLLEERDLAQPIFSHLIQNNPQITKLKLNKLDSNKQMALFTTPLPNLEELQSLYLGSAEDFIHLQSAQVQWPLKKVTMFCDSDKLQVSNVFSLIETKWAETLTHLCVIIPSNVPFSDTCSLNLPHLQKLQIKLEQYVCMDFIMPLSKSLVNLNVYHEGRDRYDEGLEKNRKIIFFLHRKNLLESNIWTYFPKLRELKYADDNVRGLCNGRLYRRNYCEQCSSVKT